MFVILSHLKQLMHKYFRLIFRAILIVLTCTMLGGSQLYGQNIPENGKYTTFHKNGKVAEKGYFKQKQKHGIWLMYSENGVILQKEKWKNGVLLWQLFYNEKGKKAKSIDKKGNVTLYPACGC